MSFQSSSLYINRAICTSYVLSLLIFFGCKSNADNDPFELAAETVFELKASKYFFSEILMPQEINSFENYLIVSESRKNSPEFPLIHILKKEPLEYLKSKGVIGFGPLEIPDSYLVEQGINDSTFMVYSSMSKKFLTYSLIDSSKLALSEYKQPESVFGMYMMYHATDSTIIGIMANDPNRLVEFNIKTGNRIGGYGTWNKIPNADHLIDYNHPNINYHLGEINKGRFRANRKLGLFVKTNGFRDRIEIFHYDTKTFDVIDGPRKEVNKFSIKNSNGQSAVIFDLNDPFGYGNSEIGEKHIYALYSGFNTKHMVETGDIAKTIYVFTHSGKVVGKFDLDTSIRSITVDEELGKIYGITTDEDPGIAVFEIPNQFLGK